MTIGMLYFLTKVIGTKAIEDKNFIFQLLTQKSLYENDTYTPYDPLSSIRKTKRELGRREVLEDTKLQHSSVETDSDSNSKGTEQDNNETNTEYAILVELIKRREAANIELAKTQVAKWTTEGQIPEFIKGRLQAIKRFETPQPNYYSFEEYSTLIVNVLQNDMDMNEEEIKSIINWLVVDYQPKDNNDFPFGLIKAREMNETNLITTTMHMPSGHPLRWTAKRIAKIKSADDYYEKLIYFDNYLYLWKMFIVGERRKVEKWEIRYKYLLDILINNAAFYHASTILIFDPKCTNLKPLLQHLHNISPVHNFLTDEQKSNIYYVKPDTIPGKVDNDVAQKYRTIHPTLDQLFEYLSENSLIHQDDSLLKF